jgi:hypothetical protein
VPVRAAALLLQHSLLLLLLLLLLLPGPACSPPAATQVPAVQTAACSCLGDRNHPVVPCSLCLVGS